MLPVHELPTWPTLSPDIDVWRRPDHNIHIVHQLTYAHVSYTLIAHHASGMQHGLSSEALVGLCLVIGLSRLDEPVVPTRIRVLASCLAATFILGVAEGR